MQQQGKRNMKILVAVKRVIDSQANIRVNKEETAVISTHVKMSINPFDEIAVEEAIRLKEQHIANEVIVVSIGPSQCQEVLRSALAMGADRSILIETTESIQPLTIAKILQTIAQQELPQIILLGKQAIDSDNNQVGQMLAGLLGCSQATFASNIAIENNHAKVTREIDGGLETLAVKLPAVITTDLRLNQPRYLSLPNIMQAKHKPITITPLTAFNIDTQANVQTIKVAAPEKRRTGIKVVSIAELIAKLKNEARVL